MTKYSFGGASSPSWLNKVISLAIMHRLGQPLTSPVFERHKHFLETRFTDKTIYRCLCRAAPNRWNHSETTLTFRGRDNQSISSVDRGPTLGCNPCCLYTHGPTFGFTSHVFLIKCPPFGAWLFPVSHASKTGEPDCMPSFLVHWILELHRFCGHSDYRMKYGHKWLFLWSFQLKEFRMRAAVGRLSIPSPICKSKIFRFLGPRKIKITGRFRRILGGQTPDASWRWDSL